MDLYNIPGDSGGWWRLNKFIEYQHEVPSIHYRVLGEYIYQYCSISNAVELCWYMSCTYNEVTCVLLSELVQPENYTASKKFWSKLWEKYKPVLDFGSARKYAKNMDWFPQLMVDFIQLTSNDPYGWLKSICIDSPTHNYKRVYKEITTIPHVGRFSADLFMECICYLQEFLGIRLKEPSKLDWKHCSNLTSGLLNMFYLDEEANFYDKTGKLPLPEKDLTRKLKVVQKRIHRIYPDQENDINLFVGKICSWRNLFKGTRYGGFHHDRELGVLRRYQESLPEYSYLWEIFFNIRREMFDPRFLGELHDWDGIRPERKKLWLKEGLTGVEKTAC